MPSPSTFRSKFRASLIATLCVVGSACGAPWITPRSLNPAVVDGAKSVTVSVGPEVAASGSKLKHINHFALDTGLQSALSRSLGSNGKRVVDVVIVGFHSGGYAGAQMTAAVTEATSGEKFEVQSYSFRRNLPGVMQEIHDKILQGLKVVPEKTSGN